MDESRNEVRELWRREYRRVRSMVRGLRACHDTSLHYLQQEFTINASGYRSVRCCVSWSGERPGSYNYGISSRRAPHEDESVGILVDQVLTPKYKLANHCVRRMMMQVARMSRKVCPLPDVRFDFSAVRRVGAPITKRGPQRRLLEFVVEIADSVAPGRATRAG